MPNLGTSFYTRERHKIKKKVKQMCWINSAMTTSDRFLFCGSVKILQKRKNKESTFVCLLKQVYQKD